MKRIGLIINSLSGGGAERVVCTLANYFASSGRAETHILSLSGGEPAFPIHPEVRIQSLWGGREISGLGAALRSWSAARGVAAWRRENRLDACVSFLHRANFANVLSHSPGDRIAISQRNVATYDYAPNSLNGLMGRALIRRLYNRADVIVCNSPGVVDSLAEIGVKRDRCSVIANPQNLESIRQAAEAGPSRLWRSNSKPRLIAVGRLIPQKGYEVLLPALARLARRLDFECLILGRGPLQGPLERLRESLGLTHHVTFYGWDDNPFAAMNEADVFLLPSRWEGFGNVMVEAMALGKPVVASDCIGSPRWILEDGQHGLLFGTGDWKDLHVKLEGLLLDRESLNSYGARALARARDFTVERMAERYLEALVAGQGV